MNGLGVKTYSAQEVADWTSDPERFYNERDSFFPNLPAIVAECLDRPEWASFVANVMLDRECSEDELINCICWSLYASVKIVGLELTQQYLQRDTLAFTAALIGNLLTIQHTATIGNFGYIRTGIYLAHSLAMARIGLTIGVDGTHMHPYNAAAVIIDRMVDDLNLQERVAVVIKRGARNLTFRALAMMPVHMSKN